MFDKFRKRSIQPEMIDSPGIDKEMLYRNLHELDVLNRKLGGHRATLMAMNRLVNRKDKKYHVVDLGCGSGDSLLYLARWARNQKIAVNFTGIDNNPHAIAYLKQHCKQYPEINGINADYRDFLLMDNKIDIIHSSLFCHHLSDQELMDLFRIFHKIKTGFIINDIKRSLLAYYSTILFTKLANASPLAKNDGPLSVLSGFKKKEMHELLNNAGIKYYHITEKFAFRIVVIGNTGETQENEDERQ